MTHQDWQVYFKDVVDNHKWLTPDSDTQHFFLGEFDEFFSVFRSKVVFPAFILESSKVDIEMLSQLNIVRRTLAFMVVDKFTRDDYSDITTRLSNCEGAAYDIIGRLQSDIRTSTMCKVRIEDVHGEPCINDPQRYIGWRFELVVNDPVCLLVKSHFRDFDSGNLLQECGHNLYDENGNLITLE